MTKTLGQAQRILGIAIILFFAGVGVSYAQNINVVFTPDPLFSESNALPGDTSTPYATVTNISGEAHEMFIGATNILDNDGLGSVIDLTITEHNNELWSGTFRELFDAGQVPLSILGAGGVTQYDFTARFQTTAGNEYQTGTLSFDIWIGFDGSNSISSGGGGETTLTSGGGSGGPGASSTGSSTPRLMIFNERVTSAHADGVQDSATTWAVTILWNTNIPATSQVIYGPVGGGSYPLNLGTPHFGYPSSTEKYDISPKVVDHQVVIPGLPAGEYAYRVVSEASPPTISIEHRFTLADVIPNDTTSRQEIFTGTSNSPRNKSGGKVLGSFIAMPSANNSFASSIGPEDVFREDLDSNVQGSAPVTIILGPEPQNRDDTSSNEDSCTSYVVITLLLILLLTLLFERVMGYKGIEREQITERRFKIAIILILIAILSFLLANYLCPIVYLVILLVILGLMLMSHKKWEKEEAKKKRTIQRK